MSKRTVRPHDSITTETRRALVDLVENKKLSVRKASKLLLLNYTTGKALISKFRKTGSIDRINKLKKIIGGSSRLVKRDAMIK